ncbi:MAG: glutamate--tRNA ligase [Candidatus Levybacteria bacterium]|nr:glutamate--tRNA ligase [Candidatus Levybacteria bacterium]
MNSVRTRIAPSPTGEDIHIGNLYTALINFAVAKKHGGKFIIRIEDTDRIRFQEGAEEKILASLKAYGVSYDEGPDVGGPFAPYRQSERLSLYKKYAEELVEKGAAYYCFCAKERLEKLREEQLAQKKTPRYDKHCLRAVKNPQERIAKGEQYVIRLNILPGKKMWFKDLIRGQITFDSSDIDDQVLLKSDGYPTYHLGVVVDDHLMQISHIIRAEEWISSTPKHVLLYESLVWEQPIFAHLPILRNPDKSKLSKRKNPVWASWYLQEGYVPEAVLNYLALMGWSHPEQREIFSLQEFIDLFDLKDVQPVGPVFDIQKLTWMNGVYIRDVLSKDDFLKRLKHFYRDDEEIASLFERDNSPLFSMLLDIARTRMKTLKDFKGLVKEPKKEDRYESEEVVLAKSLSDTFSSLSESDWNEERILEALKKFSAEQNVSMKLAYTLLTGKPQGLPLPQFLTYLGREAALRRLQRYW